jgi:hypothetical protein
LTRLLYPGPAQLDKLRFGSRSFATDELPPFDMTLVNWEEFSVSDGSSGNAEYLGGWELLDSVALGNGQEQGLIVGMM